MSRLGLALVLLFAAGPAAAASPDPTDLSIPPADLLKARDLVEALASEDFDEREDAQRDLAKMGRLALPALLAGVNNHPSPEVRFRCQVLLPKAAAADLQARLDTFLADADGKFEHDLPGWNEFRKITGGAAAARTVFVGLLADPDNRELVLAVAGPPGELGTLVAARKQEMYYWRYPRTINGTRTTKKEATAADVLTLMFAEAHVASKFVPRTINTVTVYTPAAFTSALAEEGDKVAAYRAVVGRWMDTRDDAISMSMAITLSRTLNLPKHATAVAARLVTFKGATASYRMNAALALAQSGAREHLSVLESVFADESAININRAVVGGKLQLEQIQLRDVALAAALMLTDQEPRDYGFATTARAQPGVRLSYTSWRLPEDKRKAGFAKWKTWRAENPDPKPNK